MSTNNICFHAEIIKILCGYPLLSVAMPLIYSVSDQILDTAAGSKMHWFPMFEAETGVDWLQSLVTFFL